VTNSLVAAVVEQKVLVYKANVLGFAFAGAKCVTGGEGGGVEAGEAQRLMSPWAGDAKGTGSARGGGKGGEKGREEGEKYFQAKLLDFHAKLFFTHGIGRSSR
jgi:hypothetical protein